MEFHDFVFLVLSLSDHVVFLYADGLLHKLPPECLKLSYVKPRFSMLESYIGKTHLEVEMKVRLRWNKKFDKAEAIVKGVDVDHVAMDRLFEKLNSVRRTKVCDRLTNRLVGQVD